MEKVELHSEWEDDLGICPSQCYLKMKFRNRFFVLYLRWRYQDPWSATLVECDEDYGMFNQKYEWQRLNIDPYKEHELALLKVAALYEAKKQIYLS